MNKIITIQFIVILMACLLSPNSIMAGNETVYTVSMQKQVKRQSEHNKSGSSRNAGAFVKIRELER